MTRNSQIPIDYRPHERGATLIVALIILLLMAIMGVTAMQGVTLQEKMAGNMRDNQSALFAGEIALDYAEKWINSETNNPDNAAYSDCSSNCEVIATGMTDSDPTHDGLMSSASSDIAGWMSRSIVFGDRALGDREATSIASIMAQPHFLIEYMEPSDNITPSDYFSGGVDLGSLSCSRVDSFNQGESEQKRDYCYRLTTTAVGASQQSEVILQTKYIKRFD